MSNNGVVAQWDLPSARTLDEFAAGIRRIATFQKQFRWKLGAYLVQAEAIFHERIWQYVDELGYSHAEVSNMMWVYRSIGDQYTPEIPWTYWQSMASIPAGDRDSIITRALANNITRDEIRALVGKNGSAGTATRMAYVPDALCILEIAVARAYLTVGKLIERRERGQLTLAALDELTDAAMAYREKLK